MVSTIGASTRGNNQCSRWSKSKRSVRRIKNKDSLSANQTNQGQILDELEQTDEINLAGVDERLANTRFRVDNQPAYPRR